MKPEKQEHSPAVVRRADRRDMDALLTIERQCFNVYYYNYYMLSRRDFETYLLDADSLFLVATREDRVVGYILGPIDPWRIPPTAHIDSIAVLPEVQRHRIGHDLLLAFTEEARRHNCLRVTLEVSSANAAGMAFFTGHGFREIRVLPDYYGKGLPALFMALQLR